MKRIFLILSLLLLATWLGVHVAADPGYVLFSYASWSVEMPLWVFALCLLFGLLLVVSLLRLLSSLLHSRQFWASHQKHKQQLNLEKSLQAFTQQQNRLALAYLRPSYATHRALYELLLSFYLQQANWSAYWHTLAHARKYLAISKAELTQLQLQAQQQWMQDHLEHGRWHEISKHWPHLPKSLRQDPLLLSLYCQALLQQGETARAHKLLSRALNKTLQVNLLEVYLACDTAGAAEQITQLERWLAKHPDNTDLLTVLAQRCRDEKLWGKARDYAERALAHRLDNPLCEVMGDVLEQFKETQAAIDIYRQGLLAETTQQK